MGKLLTFIALAFVAVWLLKRALARLGGEAEKPAKRSEVQGDLVRCARCGLHLPRAEARESAGALYCSEEHARLGRAAP
jgi:uncharacterized protein